MCASCLSSTCDPVGASLTVSQNFLHYFSCVVTVLDGIVHRSWEYRSKITARKHPKARDGVVGWVRFPICSAVCDTTPATPASDLGIIKQDLSWQRGGLVCWGSETCRHIAPRRHARCRTPTTSSRWTSTPVPPLGRYDNNPGSITGLLTVTHQTIYTGQA